MLKTWLKKGFFSVSLIHTVVFLSHHHPLTKTLHKVQLQWTWTLNLSVWPTWPNTKITDCGCYTIDPGLSTFNEILAWRPRHELMTGPLVSLYSDLSSEQNRHGTVEKTGHNSTCQRSICPIWAPVNRLHAKWAAMCGAQLPGLQTASEIWLDWFNRKWLKWSLSFWGFVWNLCVILHIQF